MEQEDNPDVKEVKLNPIVEIQKAIASFELNKKNLTEQLNILKLKMYTDDVMGVGLKELIEKYFGDPNWKTMSFTLIVKDYVSVIGQKDLLQMQLDEAYLNTFKTLKNNANRLAEQLFKEKKKNEELLNKIEINNKVETTTKSYVKQMENRLREEGKTDEEKQMENAYNSNLAMLKKNHMEQFITKDFLTKELTEKGSISRSTMYYFVLEMARLQKPFKINDYNELGMPHQRISDIIRQFEHKGYILKIDETDEGRVFKLLDIYTPTS